MVYCVSDSPMVYLVMVSTQDKCFVTEVYTTLDAAVARCKELQALETFNRKNYSVAAHTLIGGVNE